MPFLSNYCGLCFTSRLLIHQTILPLMSGQLTALRRSAEETDKQVL
jgi:hypothetical protein